MHGHMSPLMRQCLGATTRELSEEFRGVFSCESVARCVEESYDRIGDRPTVGPNFLPVIIERFARERLWAVAQVGRAGREAAAGAVVRVRAQRRAKPDGRCARAPSLKRLGRGSLGRLAPR